MDSNTRWKQRFENFEKAYHTFCRLLARLEQENQDEAVLMALTQAFEFTYELAWKTIKDYLESEGYEQLNSPRQTIRTAFKAGVISEAELWMAVIEKRNLASHTYNQTVLQETVDYIQREFFPLASKLYEDLKSRLP